MEAYSNESNTVLFLLYAVFAAYQSHNKGVSYRANTKALPYHAVAGIIEVLLFYSGASCSLLSILACLVHSITGLMLVKHLRKGYSVLTRPIYQAGSVLRPIVMLYAYHTGRRIDYHDAIMPIHGFVYTRIFFFLLGSIGPTTDFRKNVNSKYIYLLAVFGGALISVGHCSRPLAIPLYLVTLHTLGKLNFWTRTQVDWYKTNRQELPFTIRMLCLAGFCQFPLKSDVAMQITINDGPKIGGLPADAMGHIWTRAGICMDVPGEEKCLDGDVPQQDQFVTRYRTRKQPIINPEKVFSNIQSTRTSTSVISEIIQKTGIRHMGMPMSSMPELKQGFQMPQTPI